MALLTKRERRASRQSQDPVGDFLGGIKESASDEVSELAEGAWENLKAIGGAGWDAFTAVTEHPVAAVSEALGEAREGQPIGEVFKGAQRGLLEGFEGAEHPSLGEQIAPDNPGTAFLIDFGADPLALLPVGKMARTGATLFHKGATAAGRTGLQLAQKSDKLMEFGGKLKPGLYDAARLVLPTQTYAEAFLKRPGKVIGKRGRRAYVRYQHWTGKHLRNFNEVGARLKLDPAQRVAAVKAMRDGTIGSISDPKVKEYAQWLRKAWDDIGQEFKKHRDRYDAEGNVLFRKGEEGNPFLIFDRKAKEWRKNQLEDFKQWRKKEAAAIRKKWKNDKRARKNALNDLETVKDRAAKLQAERPSYKPFDLEPNYVPQRLKAEVIEKLVDKRGNVKKVDAVAKQLNITEDEARQLIALHGGEVKRAGHIEMARLEKIPEEMLELDPAILFPRYVQQAGRRLAMAENFGNDYQYLQKMIDHAGKVLPDGADPKVLTDIRKMFTDPYPRQGGYLSNDWAQKIMAGMVITKMGVTSTLSNISQSTNTAIVDGGANFLRGVFRSVDPAANRQMLIAYHGGLQDQLKYLAGGEKGLANTYLKFVGFDAAETVNRVLAANSGLRTAERLAAQSLRDGGKLTKNMIQRGIKRRDLDEFRRAGKFSQETEELIGLQAANRTQHVTSFLDIPMAWRSPEARVFTQYKSFVFQQSRFLFKEVMQPLNRYVASGGKEGSVAPLFRFFAGVGMVGPVVDWSRRAVREMTLNPEKRRFDRNHPLSQLVKSASYVGGLGIASDVMERALRGETVKWMFGPAVSEFGDALESAAHFGKAAVEGDAELSAEGLAKEVYRRLAPGAIRTNEPVKEFLGLGR